MQIAEQESAIANKGAMKSLAWHWPEYLMEAGELALFMFSACAFGVLLDHPASPLNQAIDNELVRRAITGIAMGLTAILIVYSRWGKQSGAHFNPAVTLTFFSLGKVAPWDAAFYVVSQFAGGITGVWVSEWLIGPPLRHSAVNYVVTRPGSDGPIAAFLAELLISCLLMGTILLVSNSQRLNRWTPLFSGALIAVYIAIEAPISGMSMNPARTFGSALVGGEWDGIWIYLTAPLLGMMLASRLYRAIVGLRQVSCAKLHHANGERCIFRCGFGDLDRNGES